MSDGLRGRLSWKSFEALQKLPCVQHRGAAYAAAANVRVRLDDGETAILPAVVTMMHNLEQGIMDASLLRLVADSAHMWSRH